jgi:magnesium-transporting ATPase (P-type)
LAKLHFYNYSLKIALVLSGVATLFFLTMTIIRSSMDYNEEGFHFDKRSLVNYDSAAIIGFTALTVISLLISLGCFFVIRKRSKVG